MKKYLLSAITALAILAGCAPEHAGPSSDIVQAMFVQKGAGAIAQSFANKLQEKISVKDFGAKGDGVTDDAAAFTAAMATRKTVFVPEGTYITSQTIKVGYAQGLWGAGRGKTVIKYTGSGVGIYGGAPGNAALIYDVDLRDFTIFSTNMASRGTYGVMLENCVYFNVDSVTILGPGSPNDSLPANRVLTGSGLYLTNNSIIGRITHTSARLWDQGMYLKTLAGNASSWTAAIVVGGQGELANNNKGIVVGDPTVNLYSGVGLTIRDMSFQGNYHGALIINSGESTVIENNYFEGNGTSDIVVGNITGSPLPIGVKILKNTMTAEDLGVNPYGSFPYTSKIDIVKSAFTTIRDNDMSISSAIPLIGIKALADSTSITGNRLNSTAAVGARISNRGTNTAIDGNWPNQQPPVKVGTFTRLLNARTGNVSYSGLGFRPSSITFSAAIEKTMQRSDGFSDGSSARSISVDGAGNTASSAYAIKIVRPTSADIVTATVVTFDEDGFTLNWGASGAPPGNALVVNYIAYK